MSALPISVLESLAPNPVLQGREGTHALHMALVRELQHHARGVTRKRRARLHQQFAQEWRGYAEGGGLRGHEGQVPSADYPLLRILQNQASGTGEPILCT